MPKWLKKTLWWLLGFGFLAVTTAGLWAPILITTYVEKDYWFPSVDVDVRITPEGDALVEERRTYFFRNGPFSYAYYNVDDPEQRVSEFSISEVRDGREVAVEPDYAGPSAFDQFQAKWSFSAEDEERTWVFRYRYDGAVDVYDDADHLYWQFIGTGWEKPTERVRGVVCLEDVTLDAAPRAWGHGPLNGSVDISPNGRRIVYRATDVPPAAYVEASIMLPPGSVSDGRQVGGAAADRIIADEQRWADEANTVRGRHETERRWVFIFLIAVPVILALFVLMAEWRDRAPGVPKVSQEPPEDDAVEAAFLWDAWRGRSSGLNAYRAQILRLVRLGAVEIRAEGRVSEPTDIKLVQRKAPDDMETEADMDFMALLFGGETDPEHTNEISISAPRRREGAGTWWSAWTRDARKDVSKALLEYRKGDARIESTGSAIVAGLGATYGIYAAVRGNGVGWWLLPVCGAALVLALRHIPARVGPQLRERVARLRAFRRYLRNFSSLPDAPALAVIIWEHYMEWAVALEVAKRVERQVRALIPQQELSTSWLGSSVESASAFQVLHTLAASSAAVAISVSPSPSSGSTSGGFGSSSSSSGFSSGGFSSGGGGGHGGSGGGAG